MNKKLQLLLKRAIDIIFSLIGLAILAIPLAIIALTIKLDSRGQIFFRQERVGKNRKLFKPWKFRTMVVGAVNQGLGYNVVKDDSRITRVGRILRGWSLDELPQLINVLKGEMSLVGPRPLLIDYLPLYTPEQTRRHEMKPGITGWAQVNGRNAISWEEKFKYDVWYVDNWSVWLDFKIVIRTALKIIKREGISPPDQPIMPRFRGAKG